MAVVERKRKKGIVYYAVREWHGKQIAELVGPNRREAVARDHAMEKELKRGEYVPKSDRVAITLRQEIELFGKSRKNANAKDDLDRLRLYVLSRPWLADMRLDEIKPKHIDRLVEELRSEKKPDGKRRLTDKTIANTIAVLKAVFKGSIKGDRCVRSPVMVDRGEFKKSQQQHGKFYQIPEVNVLIHNVAIPWPIRVLNALVLLTGMREGEAVGCRFRSLEDAPILPCLFVSGQYEGRQTKTGRERVVPIHPELSKILTEWTNEGFELYTGRSPTPDDFIVPNVSSRAKQPYHTRSSYYKAFVKHAEAAGVKPRSLHATRHTFITHCRRAGCNEDNLEKITHNSDGSIIDRYTHGSWKPLCDVVLSLNLDDLDVHPEIPSGGGNSGKLATLEVGRGTASVNDSAQFQSRPGVRFPAPPLLLEPKTSLSENARQEIRQGNDAYLDELRGANRRRKRRLLSLQEVDPGAAAPGLALCRGLDAAYSGDAAEAERLLVVATDGRSA